MDRLRVEQCDNYQKRSFRNKCIIANSAGSQVLTIPLKKGKHQEQNIKSTKISYAENWQHQHLQSIISAYGSAPYFDFYFEELEYLIQVKEEYLFVLNCKIINKIMEMLQIEGTLEFTDKYYSSEELDNDFRNKIHPRNYSHIVTAPFYPQVFSDRHPFFPNLSILDLLFCLGPESNAYLKKLSLRMVEQS